MNKIFLVVALLMVLFPTMAFAGDTYVNGYHKSNGTYVQPHYRTAPNNTINDNYSTQGNVNPYTGHAGTVKPSYSNNNSMFGTSGNKGLTGNSNNNSMFGAPNKSNNSLLK